MHYVLGVGKDEDTVAQLNQCCTRVFNRLRSGLVGSRVTVTDPVSDPVFIVFFIHALYCCCQGEKTPPWNP